MSTHKGGSKGGIRLCNPADKHVRTRKKFKVCAWSFFSH